ncbi:MAG: serine/threonine protein kinase, partial [Pseudomonadota bacterium]
MSIKHSALISAVAIALAGCGGGDIEISTATTDNSQDNSVTQTGGDASSNPCASYTAADGATQRGNFDGTNCTYNRSFVDISNPLANDLTIPLISGVHIFQGSLAVGQDADSAAALSSAGITQGGDGPTLTIEAGNTLAFSASENYVLINRGSQIQAVGTPAAPITFTAFVDAVRGTAGPEDVSLWGGMVINGFGLTNNCTDAQRSSNECHVVAEGQPSNYGGDNNADNSGNLSYVVIKHTGFEVAPGDELNGVAFNAVGSGTIVNNLPQALGGSLAARCATTRH